MKETPIADAFIFLFFMVGALVAVFVGADLLFNGGREVTFLLSPWDRPR